MLAKLAAPAADAWVASAAVGTDGHASSYRVPHPRSGHGRYTLAILTGQGQAKVTQAAPGHVQEVRRLVFDPLTKTQSRQLREIGRRITRAIDPDDHRPDNQPPPAATPARAP